MKKCAPCCASPSFVRARAAGQNFLIHEHVIEAILRLLDLQPHDQVVEIGPGLGSLTRRLVERGASRVGSGDR